MKSLLAALVLALTAAPFAAFAGPVSGNGNLLVNGSFEADPMAAGQWSVFQNLAGWTGGVNKIELRDQIEGQALDGLNFVELDVYANSSMSQTIATQAGQWYELSFGYANRAGTSVATNGLAWAFGDASGAAPTWNDSEWHTFSTRVLATGSSMTLSFSATGTSDSYGSSLDDVRVTQAVPEPASLALVLGGLGAAGWVRRRRAPTRR